MKKINLENDIENQTTTFDFQFHFDFAMRTMGHVMRTVGHAVAHRSHSKIKTKIKCSRSAQRSHSPRSFRSAVFPRKGK